MVWVSIYWDIKQWAMASSYIQWFGYPHWLGVAFLWGRCLIFTQHSFEGAVWYFHIWQVIICVLMQCPCRIPEPWERVVSPQFSLATCTNFWWRSSLPCGLVSFVSLSIISIPSRVRVCIVSASECVLMSCPHLTSCPYPSLAVSAFFIYPE